ncbi:MAG: NapC/NirT family cytochrome c [Rubrivivax sp.]
MKGWGLGLGAAALVLAGLVLGGAGKAALDHTNATAFCISCHEMKDHNWAEYRSTAHARNRTGVVAGCADCHVPHEFPDVLWRKLGAANDLWQHLAGRLDSPAAFEAHRLELARKVWARMKSTDSRECRHCHDVAAMEPTLQGRTAQKQHGRIGRDGKTCIDCHYGIAHKEPGGGATPSDGAGSS